MRYRQLSPTGDYTIGLPYFANSAECVAQAILTRLKLWQGEWFVDITDGTPYSQDVLGSRYGKNPDAAIRQRILGTPGVTQILSYTGAYTGNKRSYAVSCEVTTQYSETASIDTVLPA